MTQEVLKLALEALELHGKQYPHMVKGYCLDAITAIKEALAQPEQEPVAWGCNRYIEDDNGFQIGTDEPELAWGKFAPDDNGWWPLYTTPPQRTWVGLTGDDWKQITRKANYHWEMTTSEYAERIGELTEAKLKEKNT